MKYIIAVISLFFAIACSVQEPAKELVQESVKESATPIRIVSMYDSPAIDRSVALLNPYEIAFDIEKELEQYNLATTMKLNGGSFFVSPHSTTDFKGRFRIELQENDKLLLESDFIETPRSKEEIDPHPFVNGPVNWVSEDTRYIHRLTVTSKEDFEVQGKYVFTIEPKCTLEQVPFIIKYSSGVLSIEES